MLRGRKRRPRMYSCSRRPAGTAYPLRRRARPISGRSRCAPSAAQYREQLRQCYTRLWRPDAAPPRSEAGRLRPAKRVSRFRGALSSASPHSRSYGEQHRPSAGPAKDHPYPRACWRRRKAYSRPAGTRNAVLRQSDSDVEQRFRLCRKDGSSDRGSYFRPSSGLCRSSPRRIRSA